MHNTNKLITISVIEDSDIHRILFCEKLSDSKKFTVVSQDKLGRAGVESVKKYQPNIVLLDFQLPDITGIEVSKRIKSHFNNIKILAVTAHTEKSIIEKFFNQHAWHIDFFIYDINLCCKNDFILCIAFN